MILSNGAVTEDLLNYRDGNIEKGLGIDIEGFDKYISHKKGELYAVLGHDNVGKTFWEMWYFLALSTHHDITHTIWAGENKAYQIVRDLIQMLAGVRFNDLSHSEIRKYQYQVEHWFRFADNRKMYKADDLFELFLNSKTDNHLIDPLSGLDRSTSYEATYDFLNSARMFCNGGNTLYVSAHPTSESGRAGRIYPSPVA